MDSKWFLKFHIIPHAVEITKYIIQFSGNENKTTYVCILMDYDTRINGLWDTCHTALHGTLRHSGTFHIHTVRGQSRWSTKQRISMKNTENSFEKYIQEIYTSKASYHVGGWFNNICNGCDVNDDKKIH